MTGAEVIALVTGLPAVIGAVTALIIALRSGKAATTAQNMVIGHLVRSHAADPPSEPQ
jgi:gas vesicle protein